MAKPAPTVSSSRSVAAETPPKQLGPVFKVAAGPAKWADDRIGVAKLSRPFIRKVFPDHWSFLLGEVALYSFIILLLTGVFLTFWFKPSMAEIEYEGTYQLLRGLQMSEAFESTLAISFDIRGGLLIRQMHHWAAMLFLAAMLAHSLRIFFTGAFRKPREINWLIGVSLLFIGLIEGFAGYSLPDDLLSGTGLRFVDGLVRSIPIIGTWVGDVRVRRGVPGLADRGPPLHGTHPAHPGRAARSDRRAPGARGLPQAHPVPGSRPQRRQRRRLPGLPGLHGQGRRLLLHRLRRHHLDGRADADQPAVDVRPVQPGPGHRGQPARLVHGLRRGCDPDHAELGVPPRQHDLVVERRDPRPRVDGVDGGLDDGLPVRRAVGDRGQVRAPHPGPSAERARPARPSVWPR